jgi:nitrogen regulatory protein PII
VKQIKAFIHRNRLGDLIHALSAAGFRQVSLFEVKGLLRAISAREQEYSVELGDKVISEVQVEVFCKDVEAPLAVEIIRRTARTGHAEAGWVYVSTVDEAWPIHEKE